MGYAEVLREVGEERPDVVVLDAGLATSMRTELFARAFPERYLNVGIAEQHCVGVAAGLARRGFHPVVHSFSNFLARRAHDQVAVSVAWPGCAVTLVGGSCGVFDGRNGPSHFASDDLATMSALPDVLVAEPGDERQAAALLRRAVDRDGPSYVRLRRHGAPADLVPGGDAAAGTHVVAAHEDARCTVVAGGSMLGEAVLAHRMLADAGHPADLLHVAVLQPLDAGPILASARHTGLVVVVENHGVTGGYGDAVARVFGPLGVRHERVALPGRPLPAGGPEWLLAYCGLDARSLADRVGAFVEEAARV